MTTPFRMSRRVEFCETDAAGLAHFSSFFIFMEQAEHACLRSLGLSVVLHDPDGTLTWPRVSSSCDYTGPVRFEDVLDIEVQIERLGQKSVTYGFLFRHGDREIAKGRMTSVCCRIRNQGVPEGIAIPDWIREKLKTLQ